MKNLVKLSAIILILASIFAFENHDQEPQRLFFVNDTLIIETSTNCDGTQIMGPVHCCDCHDDSWSFCGDVEVPEMELRDLL